MKITITLFLTILLFNIGCNEASLEDTAGTDSRFIDIQVDPPAVSPGNAINIALALDNGKGILDTAEILIGNYIFTEMNSVEVMIPEDISQLLGDQTAKELRNNGYVDVPITIRSKFSSAVKYFRITGSSYEPSLYDTNPVIDSVSYKISENNIDIESDETVVFDTDSIPDKIDLFVDEVTLNENIKDNFIYSWYVFGTGSENPEIIESDEKDGSISFSLKDSSGAPLIGTFRFYLVIKPAKTHPLSFNARYCSDFFTFTVDTEGETD